MRIIADTMFTVMVLTALAGLVIEGHELVALAAVVLGVFVQLFFWFQHDR